MTKYLLNYCKSLTNIKKRKIGFIENYEKFHFDLIKNIIDFSYSKYDIVKKENSVGYYMNWHLDNAKIITHKKSINKKLIHDQIMISDRHGLYYYLEKPIISLIIYESTYNHDFGGGVLEFLDGTKIYPQRGMYILFDSNEVHRVTKILSGTRINYLIKFY